MNRTIEASGKDVADATRKALRKLGTARKDADVTILEEGRRGFLGLFGGTPARVSVSCRESTRGRAEEVLSTVLRLMTFSSQLHVTEEKNSLVIGIETAGADGLLIGKAGNTLSSIEYVVNRMLQREDSKSTRIQLDVSGYRSKREDFLRKKVLHLAKEVKSAKKPLTTEPLDAAERKLVHAVLKADPSVETKSVGTGRVKSVVLSPADGGSRPRKRRRS
ncbi:MAG: RNA-binding cell elongation regulator Jag/EloR [Candidatus Eisenbacteria bacterium]